MCAHTENELRDLGQELERTSEAWGAVRAEYGPLEVEPQMSPENWAELLADSQWVDPLDENRLTLAGAWRKVVPEARAIFLDHFVPWAVRVVAAFGVDRFPTDAPEPAHVERRAGYYDVGGAVRLLTGTSDTRDAGLRLILWAAAQGDPHLCRRSEEYPTLIWNWISNLVEFSGGICRPIREVMDWVRCGFEHLVRNNPASQPETAPALTSDVTPDGNTESQRSRYRLERLREKKMAVRVYFDGEEGVVRGTQAERLSLLIRQQRVNWIELAGSLPALRRSRSVVRPSQIEPPSGGEHLQGGARDVLVRDELENAHVRLKQLRREIQEAESAIERKELEQEQRGLRNRVRRLTHTGSGEMHRAKSRVIKDIKRMKLSLRVSMPTFVSHLDSVLRSDEASDAFVYNPGSGITWEIRGF